MTRGGCDSSCMVLPLGDQSRVAGSQRVQPAIQRISIDARSRDMNIQRCGMFLRRTYHNDIEKQLRLDYTFLVIQLQEKRDSTRENPSR